MAIGLTPDEYKLAEKVLTVNEGKKLKVYLDTKRILTVGIGCNIQANNTLPIIGRKLSKLNEPITNDECSLLFKSLFYKVSVQPLYTHLPDLMDSLDSIRRVALLDLCYNMGWGVLSDFKNTLKYLKLGDYNQAAKNLEGSKWFKQVGLRGPRIVYMVQYGKLHPDYS